MKSFSYSFLFRSLHSQGSILTPKWIALLFLYLSISILNSSPSEAFVKCLTQDGVLIHPDRPLKIDLFANLTGDTSLSELDLFQATLHSIQRWKEASQSQFQFDLWQGKNPLDFPSTGEKDGRSTLFFISSSKNPSSLKNILTKNTLGITELWYDTRSGKISEFDIILNDLDFQFTPHPNDSSGFGQSRTPLTSIRTPVFIENVITHELGHALGLSHSAALQSTMLFTESPEQAHLGCDDRIGIQTLYPEPQSNEQRGVLQGKVLSSRGAPLLGAHVAALSVHRGTLFSTTLTDKDGTYQLENLEPGLYHLLVEPYFAGSNALPEYYQGSLESECKSLLQEPITFARTFLTQKDPMKLQTFEVHPASKVQVQNLSTPCQSIIPSLDSTTRSLLEIEWEGESNQKNFGIIYQTQTRSHHLLNLNEISGNLKIHGLSYSLYSPLRIHLSLLDENKNPHPAQIKSPLQISDSGFTNFDTELAAEDLPLGRYFLQLNYEKLSIQNYPAGPVALDSIPFVVLMGTLNTGTLPLEKIIPDHPRCKSLENYPFYESPPLPQTHSHPSGQSHSPLHEINPSSGCVRTIFNPDLEFYQGLTTLIHWMIYFLGSHSILKLFNHLRSQRPADKLKL